MIRVGMIGCGKMSASHIRALAPLQERMRFTGFADIDLDRARAAASAAPGAVAVTDYEALFDHVDAVVIALPHDLHFPVGLACLSAGKHVLMEKPLALTEEECLKLIDADTSPDPVLMAGYVMRHDPMWRTMGEHLRDGTYGEPFHVPAPDAVIFKETWQAGQWFRAGAVWNIGKSKLFYFRPGPENFSVFHQPGPLRIVANAAMWLGREIGELKEDK